VVAADLIDEEIATLAHQLMLGAPGVQALIKRMVSEMAARPNDPAQAAVVGKQVAVQSAGAEAQEGMAAFLRKRKPAWVPTGD
jgi:methylglutaconyl-CoA hydratase